MTGSRCGFAFKVWDMSDAVKGCDFDLSSPVSYSQVLTHEKGGQPVGTGVAYVQFDNPDEAERAKETRNHAMLGTRYIECMTHLGRGGNRGSGSVGSGSGAAVGTPPGGGGQQPRPAGGAMGPIGHGLQGHEIPIDDGSGTGAGGQPVMTQQEYAHQHQMMMQQQLMMQQQHYMMQQQQVWPHASKTPPPPPHCDPPLP